MRTVATDALRNVHPLSLFDQQEWPGKNCEGNDGTKKEREMMRVTAKERERAQQHKHITLVAPLSAAAFSACIRPPHPLSSPAALLSLSLAQHLYFSLFLASLTCLIMEIR